MVLWFVYVFFYFINGITNMAKRYNASEIVEALSDLSNTEESDLSDSCSEYEPEDSNSDDSQLPSVSEQEENQDSISANEDNDVESNSVGSVADPITNVVVWLNVTPGFQPRLNISQHRPCTLHPDIALKSISNIFWSCFHIACYCRELTTLTRDWMYFKKQKRKRYHETFWLFFHH